VGRAESSTLVDQAEDVRSVVKWLNERKDVDPKRLAVVGHSEGAWVAMLAGARERKLAAVVSLAGSGSTGSELVLDQQQKALEQSTLSPQDRASRVALQKQIHAAVVSGKGWEGVPANVRKEADTPWMQSVLTFDPAKTLEDVRQPLLFVHGALDHEVESSNAERLAEMARKDSKSKSVELVGGARREPPVDACRHRRGQGIRKPGRPHCQQGRGRRRQQLARQDVRGGEMSESRIRITDLREKKRRGEKIAMLTAYDANMARLLDARAWTCCSSATRSAW
jgi:dienelactone hydrolase